MQLAVRYMHTCGECWAARRRKGLAWLRAGAARQQGGRGDKDGRWVGFHCYQTVLRGA